MERETQKFTTPKGIEFEVVTKLTASERNNLRAIVYEATKLKSNQNTEEKTVDISREIELKYLERMEHALINTVVKRFGEHITNVLQALLNSDFEEYDFVNKKAEEVHRESLDSFFGQRKLAS